MLSLPAEKLDTEIWPSHLAFALAINMWEMFTFICAQTYTNKRLFFCANPVLGHLALFLKPRLLRGQMWTFYVLRAHARTQTGADQTDAIWESSKHSGIFFNSQRSFHLFILRQESRDSVCSVPPQIKHSLCIPYEMYLLRFRRGGCQVLGYIKSKPSPHRERTNETGNQAMHLS